MSDESQLLALQKACEAKEQEVLSRKKEIQRVVEERSRLLDEVRVEWNSAQEKLQRLLGPDRLKAVKESDSFGLQAISEFSNRLRAQMKEHEKVIAEREKDLNMARERELLAEEELMGARLESRRVEKLLEERNFRALVRGTALEEAANDDLANSGAIKERDT